ncbi:MAG TPA: hypothetical protein VHO90_07605 [Bacteroidales bacterium]|nr:hypothetical protein [Bacteroidales bacterium]
MIVDFVSFFDRCAAAESLDCFFAAMKKGWLAFQAHSNVRFILSMRFDYDKCLNTLIFFTFQQFIR